MKRFVRSSKYLDEDNKELLIDDKIVVDVELDFSELGIFGSSKKYVRFPGIQQFKQDVVDFLENEYGFDVIEDIYDGVRQKGHISTKKGSESIYFDTYYDLSNAGVAMRNTGVKNLAIPESGKIYCFIHISFSDHDLNDEGDILHRNYLTKNAEKYVDGNPNVTHVIKEESIETTEEKLQMYYEDALDDLKIQLDLRIISWVRRADKFRR